MEYVHSFDETGRLFIPAELRKMVGREVVVTGWCKNRLCLYAQNSWEKLVEKWKDLPFEMGVETRRFQRFMFSQSMEVRLDNQGRISIPGYLKKHASLNTGAKAVIVSNDHLEIWNKENWQKRKEVRKDEEGRN